MPERDVAIRVAIHSFIIRTAMLQRFEHRCEKTVISLSDGAGNPAHSYVGLLVSRTKMKRREKMKVAAARTSETTTSARIYQTFRYSTSA